MNETVDFKNEPEIRNLLNGGTSLLFESLPNFPDPGRYWSMVEKHKLTQFFSAPTAYRMLMQYDNSWVEKYDLSSLKVCDSSGQPTHFSRNFEDHSLIDFKVYHGGW